MPEPAGILLDWARLDVRQARWSTRLEMGECRVPVDASQRVVESMLKAAIQKWLRWQEGRGRRLVSDVRVGKASSTFGTRTGTVLSHSKSYRLSGAFQQVVERADGN